MKAGGALRHGPRDRDQKERDEMVAKLLADPRSKTLFTLDAIREAGKETSSSIWGLVKLLGDAFGGERDRLADWSENDRLRVADSILRHLTNEAIRNDARGPAPITASRLRKGVEAHLGSLRATVKQREADLAEAQRALGAAADRVSEYDTPAHRMKMREAADLCQIREAQVGSARVKAGEFAKRLKTDAKEFDRLVELAIRGSHTTLEKRLHAQAARFEVLVVELLQIADAAIAEMRETQEASAIARQLADDLGVDRRVLVGLRDIDMSDVRSLIARAASAALRVAGKTATQARDLLATKDWGSTYSSSLDAGVRREVHPAIVRSLPEAG